MVGSHRIWIPNNPMDASSQVVLPVFLPHFPVVAAIVNPNVALSYTLAVVGNENVALLCAQVSPNLLRNAPVCYNENASSFVLVS